MSLSKYVWKNGKIIDGRNAKTNIFCQGLHYGMSVFEGIRFYDTGERGPAIFRLDKHLERFDYSQRKAYMLLRYSPEVFTDAIKELIKKSELREGYIRPIAWFGEERLGLRLGEKTHVAIAVFPWNKRLEQEQIRAKISKYLRIDPRSAHVEAKISGHYVNSILALRDAIDSGFDEAILLDWTGMVAEGSAENIFMAVNGNIYTPPRGSILDGVTRRTILVLARDYGYRVEETFITPEALFKSGEVFLCGTAMEVLPVVEIQRESMGQITTWTSKSNEVTSKFANLYAEVVRGKHSEYSRWLTYAYE